MLFSTYKIRPAKAAAMAGVIQLKCHPFATMPGVKKANSGMMIIEYNALNGCMPLPGAMLYMNSSGYRMTPAYGHSQLKPQASGPTEKPRRSIPAAAI